MTGREPSKRPPWTGLPGGRTESEAIVSSADGVGCGCAGIDVDGVAEGGDDGARVSSALEEAAPPEFRSTIVTTRWRLPEFPGFRLLRLRERNDFSWPGRMNPRGRDGMGLQRGGLAGESKPDGGSRSHATNDGSDFGGQKLVYVLDVSSSGIPTTTRAKAPEAH